MRNGLRKKMGKKASFTVVTNNLSLIKQVKDMCNKNFKSLKKKKEIKEDLSRINIVKMPVLLKEI